MSSRICQIDAGFGPQPWVAPLFKPMTKIVMVSIDRRLPARRLVRGSLLVDGLIGSFLVLIAGLGFFALFPTIHRTSVMSKQESTAVLVANRMLDHLQMLRVSNLDVGTLLNLNLIDKGQSNPPYSFANVPLDDASGYSPAKLLPDAQAEFDVVPIDNGCQRIEMLISWRSPTGVRRSLRTGTIIGGFR